MVEVLLLAAVLVVAASLIGTTLQVGISPLPSSRAQTEAMLALLSEEAAPASILELGSGWGGLVLALARRFPEARILGIEASVVPWCVSVLRVRAAGLSARVTVRRARLEDIPLPVCEAYVSYLHRSAMAFLSAQLLRSAPGARWVSNTFGVRGWRPEQTRVLADVFRTHIYLYRVPQAREV